MLIRAFNKNCVLVSLLSVTMVEVEACNGEKHGVFLYLAEYKGLQRVKHGAMPGSGAEQSV